MTRGDAAILRFLAAAEIIETDLWQQYNELAGIQDGEVPGGSGNPAYGEAVAVLDEDMDQYIHDNTDDEISHFTFINAYLRAGVCVCVCRTCSTLALFGIDLPRGGREDQTRGRFQPTGTVKTYGPSLMVLRVCGPTQVGHARRVLARPFHHHQQKRRSRAGADGGIATTASKREEVSNRGGAGGGEEGLEGGALGVCRAVCGEDGPGARDPSAIARTTTPGWARAPAVHQGRTCIVSLTQYYTATSLDGFIADRDNSLDWLFTRKREDDGPLNYGEFIAGVGAMAMGSTTYEWILDHEFAGKDPAAWKWPYDIPCWVFTHRQLPAVPNSRIEFTSADIATVHKEMIGAAGDRNVWIVGGGDLAGQVADVGLLDEVIVSIAPVTLGGGAPLLPRRLELRLDELGRNGDFACAKLSVVRPPA